MTRINLVDPTELYDQHLIAERREIRLLCAHLRKSLASKRGVSISRIPSRFTLNRGHVTFFYDKGKYLHKRYIALTKEMIRRGFKPDLSNRFPVSDWPTHLYNDWTPSERDLSIIRARIALRLSQRSGWYRKSPVITRILPKSANF